MADTFLRYLVLLGEIPRAPRRIGAGDLTLRLESHGIRVTRRTVQRDLERLSSILPIGCNDKTKPFGWAWLANAAADAPQEAGLLRLRKDFPQFERPRAGTLLLAVRFTQPAEHVLRALPPPRRVERCAEHLYLEVSVADTLELRTWLLGFGTRAEVLAPSKLRSEFRRITKRLAAMYAQEARPIAAR
ncbi:MAG TPA: WYL domain-containing protein [Polyangiaceae bacterium]|nr:WYL domain-containing protein [Polyangiaceae bacterium]HMR74892.1 WYL domain-containing protein [Polyangiaceae bacterium]